MNPRPVTENIIKIIIGNIIEIIIENIIEVTSKMCVFGIIEYTKKNSL